MSDFEILCVTMNQCDFRKIKQMNIHSDVLFANQCDVTSYEEINFEGNIARMISSQTRGVGNNRNIALTYANADICLIADDDIVYHDDLKKIVLGEFKKHPNADVIIFNIKALHERGKQIVNHKSKRCTFFMKMPYPAMRIAFRLDSIRRNNIFFSTLFGGGCIYSCGEDSIFIKKLMQSGLCIYVTDQYIGTVDFGVSTWFEGYTKKYFYDKGAYCKAVFPKTALLWKYYYAWRFRKEKNISYKDKIRLMSLGIKNYSSLIGYGEYLARKKIKSGNDK